ncbi:excinuclease ABC subunit B [Microgenomates group bacterium RBG_16_45_19]|nr:MAG: excinuclease ABC subunit B [Microgenomates group bacterium RBG_16_45_19]
MPLKLKAPFSPQGDQPQAIDQLSRWILKGQPQQTLLGVTGSGKTFTLANVIARVQRQTLVISHNKTLAAQLYQEFRDFFPDNAVSYFVSYYDYYQPESYLPATDTYIEKETDINDEIDKLRLSATANLLSRPDVIVVASVSCLYNLGSPLNYSQNFLELVPGQLIDRTTVVNRLVDMQYRRSDYDLKRGTFRQLGDQLTVWPAHQSQALKLTFLDDQLETITPIDPLTAARITPASPTPGNLRFVIFPAKHYQTSAADHPAVFRQIRQDLADRLRALKAQGQTLAAYRLSQRVKYDLDMMAELGYVNGIENYSRYFDGRRPGQPPSTLLDYFALNQKRFYSVDEPYLTLIDESHITLPQIRSMAAGDRARKQTLIDFGFRLPSALDNRPLTYAEFSQRTPQLIYASATPAPVELNLSQGYIAEQLLRPTGLIDPDIEVRPSAGQIANLVSEILRQCCRGERVLVATLTKRQAEALAEYLNQPDHFQDATRLPKVNYLHADIATLDRQEILDDLRHGTYDVIVGINLLREGLDLPEVSLVAILDADKEGFLRSTTSLIQMMGRAARHQHGHVIMYADHQTASISQAIAEVNRRRRYQKAYNKKHHLQPRGIAKPIRRRLLKRPVVTPTLPQELQSYGWTSLKDIEPDQLTPQDRRQLTSRFKKLMNQAARDWQFEQAARYRDLIHQLTPTAT